VGWMKRNIVEVKALLEDLVGKNVDLVVNKGRKKLIKFNAKIENVYPSMFVISPNENVDLDRFSYSFNDVMCGDIKIMVN
jgi:uncharacterized protein Veg